MRNWGNDKKISLESEVPFWNDLNYGVNLVFLRAIDGSDNCYIGAGIMQRSRSYNQSYETRGFMPFSFIDGSGDL